MFGLTFLGTSGSVPSAERNHPGLLVETGTHRIVVDCGEGTQRQLLRSGADYLYGFRTSWRLNREMFFPGFDCRGRAGRIGVNAGDGILEERDLASC